jgi:hypothetical protein
VLKRTFALLLPALLCSCRSLERFDTGSDTAYCGSMLSAGFVRGGLLPPGNSPYLALRMTLDTAELDTVPGLISTDDAVRGLCAPLPLFQDAELRAVEQVAHDDLALLEFGTGREHNFVAYVESTCQGSMVAIVSLMKDDSVELRLLKPGRSASAQGDAAIEPGFGIFKLRQQRGSCDF